MKTNDLTTGSIFKKIIIIAVPLIIANLLQVSYNFMDMFFVGMYLPQGEGLSALGTAGNYVWLASSYILFSTIGTQVLIGQSVGAKDIEKTKSIAQNGLILTLILSIIYCVIIFVFSEPLIEFFKIQDDLTNKLAIDYLKYVSIAIFFIMLNTLFNGIFQALGNTKMVLIISCIGVISNIILDPLFIFVFDTGVIGAAVATAIASAIVTCIYLFILIFKSTYFKGRISLNYSIIKKIFSIGKYAAIQNMIFTFSAMIVAVVILKFGQDALAAQRVGSQVESFTWMIGIGISTTVSVFTAQNYGANKLQRIKHGYVITLKMMLCYGALTSLVFYFFGGNLISLFTKNQEIVNIGFDYMKIISYSQIAMLIEGVSAGIFNGISKTKIPAIYGITGNILRLVLVFVLSSLFSISGIWYAITISSIFKGLLLTIHLFIYMRKNKY